MKLKRSSAVIAVVDDDESFRSAIAGLLRSASWKVRMYSSADQLLNDTRRSDVRLVISDIQMPDMDGFALLKSIGEWKRVIPVIFITGYPTHNLKERSYLSGASGFFEKPVDDAQLLAKIDEVLRK
jgi:FixJ family two-component response regulator